MANSSSATAESSQYWLYRAVWDGILVMVLALDYFVIARIPVLRKLLN